MKNIANQTIKGLVSMSFSSISVFLIQLITTVVLGRIFSPTEFGVVSAITIVTSYTDIFYKMGIGPSIIQKKNVSEEDISTGHVVSIIAGFISTLLVSLFSQQIAMLININNPYLIKIISLSFIINGISSVPLSLLQREMKFNYIMVINISSNFIYMLMAIIFGLLGYSSLGLIMALLLRYIFSTLITLFYFRKYIPLRFSSESLKGMLKFGLGFSLSQLLSVTTSQGDYFVVTRRLGSYSLGVYSKAYQLMSVPANLIGQVIDEVFFPMMSKIQDDNERLSKIFSIVTVFLAYIIIPVGLGISKYSEQIILILLGSQWTEASKPLSILSFSIFFRIAYKICDPIFRAKGVVYKRSILHLINALFTISLSLLGSRNGLVGVSIGVSIALIANYILIIYFTNKLISIDFKRIILSIIPLLFGSIIVIALMQPITSLLSDLKLPLFINLSINGIFFLLSYLLIYLLIFLLLPSNTKNKITNSFKLLKKN